MNVFWVLNNHSHVMYISRILLAKNSEVKVSLELRNTTAYTTLSTTKVWRLIQCIYRHCTLWKYYLIRQEYNSEWFEFRSWHIISFINRFTWNSVYYFYLWRKTSRGYYHCRVDNGPDSRVVRTHFTTKIWHVRQNLNNRFSSWGKKYDIKRIWYSNHAIACNDHITLHIYNAQYYNWKFGMVWKWEKKTWVDPTTPFGKWDQYKGRVAWSKQ